MTKSILTILFFISSFVTFAQTAGVNNKVIVDNTVHFALKPTSDLNSVYTLDIKAIPFKDGMKAESFFGGISDNLLTFSYDKVNNIALLTLNHYPGATVVTVEQWNAYINSNAARYLKIYKEINK